MAYRPVPIMDTGGVPKRTPTASYANMIRSNQYSLFGNSSVPQTSVPQRQTAIKPKPVPTPGKAGTASRPSTSTSTPSSSSGVTSAPSYNNVPVDNWANQISSNIPKSTPFSTSSSDAYVDQLRKQITPKSSGPKLPEQINLDKYRTELSTIRDLEKKYGFDYSRDYAERQAEVLAQAQRDALASARERAEYETESAQVDLEHDFFNKYLQQRQGMADTGLNAGIAAERDLRLGMDRQHALADILANAQLYNQELDRNAATIDKEQIAYAEQLYNDRLAQAFGMSMDMSRFNQSENQFQAQAQMQQRQQIVEERWREYEFNNMSKSQREQLLQSAKQHGDEMAWRQYEFNNMSASEKAKLQADADKFGMEMAWQRHKFEAGLAFEASGNFNSGGGGGGSNYPASSFKTTKGTPPKSFQNHLSQAIKATGVNSSWIQPMSQLIANESSWNPSAKNPNSTAHGYGQFLNSTRRDYEKRYGIKYDTPVNQLILTIRYVQDRYGTPQKAMEFWNKNKWY